MAEIEFRLPSAIPYAYVNVKGTPEEIAQINYELLASLYANSLNAFQAAEIEAAKLIVQGGAPKPEAAKPAVESAMDAGIAAMPGNPEAAMAHLQAGDEVIKEQLGATELDSVNAPWDNPKAAKAKPWEKKRPAAKLDVDPDFF